MYLDSTTNAARNAIAAFRAVPCRAVPCRAVLCCVLCAVCCAV
eukprot:COSAG05_NODE_24072_length_254_cov_0.612903_2_plen_42_part_01